MFLVQENCTDKLNAFSFTYFLESYVHDKQKKPFTCKCVLKIYNNSFCCPRFQLSLDNFCQVEHFCKFNDDFKAILIQAETA